MAFIIGWTFEWDALGVAWGCTLVGSGGSGPAVESEKLQRGWSWERHRETGESMLREKLKGNN